MFTGNIISITPSEISAGDPLKLKVEYHAETTSWFEKINGWSTGVKVSSPLATQKVWAPGYHYGGSFDGSLVIYLGAMPSYPQVLTVELIATPGGFSLDQYTIDVKTHYIEALESDIPIPPPNGDEDETPFWWEDLPEWAIPAIILGVLAIVVARR